jgi:siroheme synthase-like protein
MAAATYPVFLNLDERPVLLIGAGHVALRKARGLLEAGARLTVVAPQRHPDFAVLPPHTYLAQPYAAALLDAVPRWMLALAATDRPAVNTQLVADARARGILGARCDDPELGDFVGAAVLRRPGVTIALGTHGASPALATRLRDQIAAGLDPILLQLSERLGAWRPRILAECPDPAARRALLVRLASPEMEAVLRAGGTAAADQTFASWLHAGTTDSSISSDRKGVADAS